MSTGENIVNVMKFFVPKLDEMYEEIVGHRCGAIDGQCLVIFQTFGDLCPPSLEYNIRELFAGIPDFSFTIRENRFELPFYHQGTILFLFYLLKRHRNRLIEDWPLDRELLSRVATNIGVSLDR